MNEEEKTRIALWRLGVLGPLVSARLERGDRRMLFEAAARRTYVDHDGRQVEVSSSTVESWYYLWLHGGWEALKPRERSDAGLSRSIPPDLAELLVALKRENPKRSIRRLILMVERDGRALKGSLSKSSVHRLLKVHDISARPKSGECVERRAFRHRAAGDLWMGDVMHGPQAYAPDGRVRKTYLHLFLDSATRFVTGSAFRFSETAAEHESVLKQALLVYGLPRILYLDRGPAQISGSLSVICAELGVRLLHTRPYDPAAKGAVERIFRTIRDEVLSELGSKPLPIEELNSILWSWLSVEYHRRIHSGTVRKPLEHWLEQAVNIRSAPKSDELDRIFLHRESRKVRKDATLRFHGRMLEVRPELCGLEVELRYDPERPGNLPQVFMDGKFYCDTAELDLERNSLRRRHRPQSAKPEPGRTGIDPLKQIRNEHQRRSRPPKPSDNKEI